MDRADGINGVTYHDRSRRSWRARATAFDRSGSVPFKLTAP